MWPGWNAHEHQKMKPLEERSELMALLHAFACQDLGVVEPWMLLKPLLLSIFCLVKPRTLDCAKVLPEPEFAFRGMNSCQLSVPRPQLPDVEQHLLHPSMIAVAYGQASVTHCIHTSEVSDNATVLWLCPTVKGMRLLRLLSDTC